jgi:hypothetical protein
MLNLFKSGLHSDMEFHVVLPHSSSSDSDPETDHHPLSLGDPASGFDDDGDGDVDDERLTSPGGRSHTSQQSAIMMDVADEEVEALVGARPREDVRKICKIKAHRVVVSSR